MKNSTRNYRRPWILAFTGVALCLGSAGDSLGQSFNIDISDLRGSPPATFGGAANQPGFWNVEDNSTSGFLRDLDGQLTGVRFNYCCFGGVTQGSDHPDIGGDVAKLVEDAKYAGHQGDTFSITLNDVVPGIYEVYTYAWHSPPLVTPGTTEVFMYHSVVQSKTTGGVWPGSLQEGVTHTKHRGTAVVVPVLPEARLDLAFGDATGSRYLSGVQVVYIGPPGDSYCTSTPNSTGQAAVLSTSGSVSVFRNDLVLHAAPVPNLFGLFFYGPDQVQLPLWDGFLCVGPGSVGHARLPVTLATGNVLTSPLDLENPPFPAATIAVLSTWNFQAWFRDSPAGGSGANLSDARRFTFLP